jgi:DNA replication protein DnaC
MAMIEGDAWLGQGANLLLFGPPGVGKTHLIASIGHALSKRGKRVYFTRTVLEIGGVIPGTKIRRDEIAMDASA